jgi:hypothetical protein
MHNGGGRGQAPGSVITYVYGRIIYRRFYEKIGG